LRRHAKAPSAGSSEGTGSSRGLFRRAFPIRGGSSDSKRSGAPSFRRAKAFCLTLVLGALAFALTAGPAFGAGAEVHLDEPATPSYTSINVTGFVKADRASPSFIDIQISTDGVNYENCFALAPSCNTGFTPGEDSKPISVTIPNLIPGTQYYFRIFDFMFDTSLYSNVVTTTTLPVAKPSVLTVNDATDVSYTSAKVSGSVEGADQPDPPDPAFDSDCRFEYVTDAQFAANGYQNAGRTTCYEPVTGSGPTPVTADLTNLKPGTTYHLRLTNSNAGGADSKEASTFTTLSVDPPTILTINDTTNVEYSQAELTGEVERPANPDPAFDTQCRFEYVSTLDSEARGDTQRLTVTATGGTYRLADSYFLSGSGVVTDRTSPIAFDASAAVVQSAIETLPRVGSGNVSVTGGPGDEAGEDPYTIVFIGAKGNKDVEQLFTDSTGLTVAGESSAQVQTISDGHGAIGFNNYDEFGNTHVVSIPCEPAETITNPDGIEPIKVPVSAKPIGLAPGTTYRYRLVVSNAGGSETKEAVNTFTTLVPGAPAVSILPVTDVTATSAHLAGKINPGDTDAGFNVDWHFRCTPKCPGLEVQTIAADENEHEVEVDATGLRANTTYSVVLVATNAAGRVIAGPEQFTTGAVKPLVTTFPAFALAGGTQALVGGKVDAENSATKFWIEYGSDQNYGASIPLNQEGDADAGNDPVFVTQKLSGLQPGATYHYRLIASNSVGTVQGNDYTFTTPTGSLGSSIGGSALPDNRAWEMVSPPEKNGGEIFPVEAQAAVSGARLMFKSQGSFADQPTAKGGSLSEYIATRGAGAWSTHGIMAPGGTFCQVCFSYEVSDELNFSRFHRQEPASETLDPTFPVDPNALAVADRNYIRNNTTDTYRIQPDGFVAASDDYRHIVIQSDQDLTGEGCEFICTYETVDNGPLRGVGKKPGSDEFEYAEFKAISKDGSRIFYNGKLAESMGEPYVFVRINGTETVQLDKSERTVPPVAGGATSTLVGINASGERALLNSEAELVDADENGVNDLYLWDSTKPEGERLTLVSQGDVPGIAGVDDVLGTKTNGNSFVLSQLSAQEGLQRGYFTSANQLLAGESDAPGQKIYFWDAAGPQPTLSYVATAQIATYVLNGIYPYSMVRVSSNGRYLAFASTARLTAYENGGKREIYRYDSGRGQLACVSCDPEGRAAKSNATFQSPYDGGTGEIPRVTRNVTNQGQVFFESGDALALGDTNGKVDVYEYAAGLPYLLSAGTGSVDSAFLDASASGEDVFITTNDQLVGWDVDHVADAYDVRTNGGLPEPPPPIIGCDGDACQPPPTPPNDPTPASSNFNGAGNVVKKAAHKKKKQRKAHKKKKQQKKRQHSRNSTRKNG
jgi:hypothetical protein